MGKIKLSKKDYRSACDYLFEKVKSHYEPDLVLCPNCTNLKLTKLSRKLLNRNSFTFNENISSLENLVNVSSDSSDIFADQFAHYKNIDVFSAFGMKDESRLYDSNRILILDEVYSSKDMNDLIENYFGDYTGEIKTASLIVKPEDVDFPDYFVLRGSYQL